MKALRIWPFFFVLIMLVIENMSLQFQVASLRKDISGILAIEAKSVNSIALNADSIKNLADASNLHSQSIQQLSVASNQHTRTIHGLIRLMYVLYQKEK